MDTDTTRVKHQIDLRSQQTLSLQKYLENYDEAEEIAAYKILAVELCNGSLSKHHNSSSSRLLTSTAPGHSQASSTQVQHRVQLTVSPGAWSLLL